MAGGAHRGLCRLGPLALALALLGCGGERPSGSGGERPGSGPALCGELRSRVTGQVTAPAATELSGLALSRTQPRVLWTHNDSGDRPRVLGIGPGGNLIAEIAVAGADNVDWEDLAIGPAPGGGDALYLGDIGDNDTRRATVTVYRVAEPRLAADPPAATAPAQRLVLRYPDGAHDAEALLVDPSDGSLAIATKTFGDGAVLYAADRPRAGAVTTLRRAVRLPVAAGEAVTAGDVSSDGRTVALRTYDRALVWPRRRGESLAAALRARPCSPRADLSGEGQGEALALSRDGRSFYTIPEGRRPLLRRYEPSARRSSAGVGPGRAARSGRPAGRGPRG